MKSSSKRPTTRKKRIKTAVDAAKRSPQREPKKFASNMRGGDRIIARPPAEDRNSRDADDVFDIALREAISRQTTLEASLRSFTAAEQAKLDAMRKELQAKEVLFENLQKQLQEEKDYSEKLREAIEASIAPLAKMEDTHADLRQQLSNSEERHIVRDARERQLDEELHRVRSELEVIRTDAGQIHSDNKQYESRLKQIISDNAELRQQLATSEQRRIAQETREQQLDEELHQIRNELEVTRTDADLVHSRNRAYETRLEQIGSANAELRQQLASSEQRDVAREAREKQLDEELRRTQAELESVRIQSQTDADQIRASARERERQLEVQRADSEARLSERDRDLARRLSELESLQKALETARAEASQSRSRSQHLDQALFGARQDAARIATELEVASAHFRAREREWQDKLTEEQQKLLIRVEKSTQLEASLELSRQELLADRERLSALEAQLNEERARFESAENSAQAVLMTYRMECEQLKGDLALGTEQVIKLETELAAERDAYAKLRVQAKAEQSELEGRLQGLGERLGETTGMLHRSEIELASANRSLAQMNDNYARQADQLSDTQAQLSRERQRSAELIDDISVLSDEHRRMLLEMAKLQRSFEDEHETVNTLRNELEQIERQGATHRAKIHDLERQLDSAAEHRSADQRHLDVLTRKIELMAAHGAKQDKSARQVESRLAEVSVLASRLGETLVWRDSQLEVMQKSWSWKVTAVVRAYRRLTSRIIGTVRRLRLENPLFDREWYLTRYPDVKSCEIDAYEHYVKNGVTEGRNPNALFDTVWYLEKYKDVAETGMNPLDHFLRHGIGEGRDPHPLYSTEWCVKQASEAGIGSDPLRIYKYLMTQGGPTAPNR